MRRVMTAAVAMVLATAALAQDEVRPMTFTDAIEVLNRERLSAETCARIVKRFLPAGDAAALTEAEAGYEGARTEFNAVIVRLQTALVDKTEDGELVALKTRAEAASAKRAAFCARAEALMPTATPGEKSIIGDIVAATVGELVDAVTWFIERGDRERERVVKQYTTRLEDEKWKAFGEISAN